MFDYVAIISRTAGRIEVFLSERMARHTDHRKRLYQPLSLVGPGWSGPGEELCKRSSSVVQG